MVLVDISSAAASNMQKDSRTTKYQLPVDFSIVKIKTYPKYSSFEEATLYTARSKSNKKRLTNYEFFHELASSFVFRKLFIKSLKKSKYQNYFLEFMPVKAGREQNTAVKFMLIKEIL